MYNGWKNYETWLVYSWFNNDERLYNTASKVAADLKRGSQSAAELAELYMGHVKSEAPDTEPGIYRDLLQSAIDNVDFHEIAAAFMEDVEQ